MRKSFFTVDFQNKETKTESSRPGLRSGVSVCQKGCGAPRASTPRSGSAVRSLRRKAGQAAKRVRSTEGEHAAQRKRSPKPATQSGAGRKKGAEHRGRARRAAAAQSEARDAKRGRPPKGCEAPRTRTALKGLPQSEACDAKRGRPPKRVRSTEGEHAAQRQRSPKPATQSGAGRKKGAKPVTRRGTGCRRAFYIHFP